MAETKESMGAFLRRVAESPAAAANSEVLDALHAEFVQEEKAKLKTRLVRVKSALDAEVTMLNKYRREAAKSKARLDALEKLADDLVAGEATVSEGFEVAFDKARYC